MAVDSTGLIDVLDTIREFAVTLTVYRETNEDDSDGYVTTVFSAVASVSGHMQPYSPKELRNVPEGQNTLEWHHIWSLQELKTGDRVSDGTAPTVVVQRVEYWKEPPFWHAHAVTVTDDISLPPSIYTGEGDIIIPVFIGSGVGAHP